MDVSPSVLRRETVSVLKEVEQELSLSPNTSEKVVLLAAKAAALNTLVLLRGQ